MQRGDVGGCKATAAQSRDGEDHGEDMTQQADAATALRVGDSEDQRWPGLATAPTATAQKRVVLSRKWQGAATVTGKAAQR